MYTKERVRNRQLLLVLNEDTWLVLLLLKYGASRERDAVTELKKEKCKTLENNQEEVEERLISGTNHSISSR